MSDGAAAGLVGDADYLVFCPDDIDLGPTAIRGLVETATATDAGIVGPKVADTEDPRRLRHMGFAVTATGNVIPLVEPGEYDQGQHDGRREVFAVPGDAMLVNARLFRRVGGFDEALTNLTSDVSLCWRARLAGARVVVSSTARVMAPSDRSPRRLAHDQDGAGRQPGVGAAATFAFPLRHRVRLVATCCGRRRSLMLLPALFLLTLLRTFGALLSGRVGDAWELARTWPWNLRRGWSCLIARRQVRRFRRRRDRQLAELQVSGFRLLRLHLRREQRTGGIGSPTRQASGAALPASNGAWRRTGASRWEAARRELTRWSPGAFVVALGVVAVLVGGGRHLFTQGVPAVGELLAFDPPGHLASQWWSGWNPAGLGSDGNGSALPAALSALGGLLGGHMGLAHTLLTVGLIPLGALGAFRMLRYAGSAQPIGSPRAGVAAAVAYAAFPVPYTALAAGHWQPLVVYAAAPWLLARLAAASGRSPASGPAQEHPDPTAERRRRLLAALRDSVALGILVALVALVVPSVPFLVALATLGLAAGGVVVFDIRGIVRMGAVAATGVGVAGILHLPWVIAGLRSGSPGQDGWWGTGPGVGAGPELGATGGLASSTVLPLGLEDAPALWALLGAAALALLVGRQWRLAWATRGWLVALIAYGLVWLAERPAGADVLAASPVSLPPAELVLMLAGAGIALAVGCGVAAIECDVAGRSRRFGLRRLAAGAALVALAGASLSVTAAALPGDWGLEATGFTRLFVDIDRQVADAAGRTLWVGRDGHVPGHGWPLPPGGTAADTANDTTGPRQDSLLYATTTGQAHPTVTSLLPGPERSATPRLADVLAAVRSGETARAGELLAPMAVQYIVVPLEPAVDEDRLGESPAVDDLVDGLSGQLDLERISLDPEVLLYRNLAARPSVTQVPLQDGAVPAEPPGHLTGPDADVAAPLLRTEDTRVPVHMSGRVEGDAALVLAASDSPHWSLSVDGVAVERRPAWGWANSFVVAAPGQAELSYDPPWSYRAVLVFQVAAWVAAAVTLVLLRDRVLPGRRSAESATPTPTADRWIALPTETDEYVRFQSVDEADEADADESVLGADEQPVPDADDPVAPGLVPAGGDEREPKPAVTTVSPEAT